MSIWRNQKDAYINVLRGRLSELIEEYSRTLHLRDKDIRDDLIARLMEARSIDSAIIDQLLDQLEKGGK